MNNIISFFFNNYNYKKCFTLLISSVLLIFIFFVDLNKFSLQNVHNFKLFASYQSYHFNKYLENLLNRRFWDLALNNFTNNHNLSDDKIYQQLKYYYENDKINFMPKIERKIYLNKKIYTVSSSNDDDGRLMRTLLWQIDNFGFKKKKPKKEHLLSLFLYEPYKDWWGTPLNNGEATNCPNKNFQCRIYKHADLRLFNETRDILNVSQIDAVLSVRDAFHERLQERDYKLIEPSSELLKIYLLMESPFVSSTVFLKNELIMSYWRGSEIYAPYNKFIYFNKVNKKIKAKDYSKNKTKMAAIFVSNCMTTNDRLNYVTQLQLYISVDIYGFCGDLVCERSDPTCFNKLQNEYRFYLAFENACCVDYITEKFFVNALRNDIIPVVLGARKSDYEAVAPTNSFIHVNDFKSPKHLAEYLLKLAKSPKKYNKYFEWKNKGKFITTFESLRNSAICKTCSMAYYYKKQAQFTQKNNQDNQTTLNWTRDNFCLPQNTIDWTKY